MCLLAAGMEFSFSISDTSVGLSAPALVCAWRGDVGREQTPVPGRTVIFLAAQNSPKMEAIKTQTVVGVSTAQSGIGRDLL